MFKKKLMEKVCIHKLSGKYWGFVVGNYLYDINNEYFGWIDDENSVWLKNGKYLGKLYKINYIVVNNSDIKPISRMPIEEPLEKVTCKEKIDKMRRTAEKGWSDALKNIK